jgi:hypothetical protein
MKAMKKPLWGLSAVALAIGVVASTSYVLAAPTPSGQARKDRKLSRDDKPVNVGPVVIATGFEAEDGWELGFICGPEYVDCAAGGIPASGCAGGLAGGCGNCDAGGTNSATGWFMSNSSTHCFQPEISDGNPASGTQNLHM